jgi:hypothetical protein
MQSRTDVRAKSKLCNCLSGAIVFAMLPKPMNTAPKTFARVSQVSSRWYSSFANALLLTIGLAFLIALAGTHAKSGAVQEMACYAALSSDLSPLISHDTQPETRCSARSMAFRK